MPTKNGLCITQSPLHAQRACADRLLVHSSRRNKLRKNFVGLRGIGTLSGEVTVSKLSHLTSENEYSKRKEFAILSFFQKGFFGQESNQEVIKSCLPC